jgi:hypothetical protein
MRNGTDLIVAKLAPACRTLAEASNATQAKRVADLARAAEVYAQQQKLGEEAARYAHAVKIDAMTLMGEFLKVAPKNEGTRTKGGGTGAGGSMKEPPATPTLADLRIDKKSSATAQALATLQEKAPDLHEQVRKGEMTVSKARAELKERLPPKAKKSHAERAAAQGCPGPRGSRLSPVRLRRSPVLTSFPSTAPC